MFSPIFSEGSNPEHGKRGRYGGNEEASYGEQSKDESKLCRTHHLCQQVPVLDPVNEICLDLEVKIADLGNACWVVSK